MHPIDRQPDSAASIKSDGDSLPRWARAADAATVLLVLSGIAVMFSGGFRTDLWGVRVAATSESRFWLAAGALVLLRHAGVRKPSLGQRLGALARLDRRSPATRAALPVFLATRPTILIVGYLAVIMVGYPRKPPFRVSLSEFWNLPARWDAGWYMGIANDGYSWNWRRSTGQQNIAFFPAFPMLMRVGGYALGSESNVNNGDLPARPRRTLWAGVLISLGAFYGALVYLFKLAREQIGEERAARALVLLAAYPFAVFYSTAYTESLFLLAVVAAFYHAHRDEWVRAGVLGMLIGLTRPNGCLVSVPLALLAIERRWPAWWGWRARGPHASARTPADSRAWRLLARLSAAAMPGVGLLAYSVFIYYLTGRPFAWAEVQVGWGREYRGLQEILSDSYPSVVEQGPLIQQAWLPFDVWNGIPFLLIAATIWPVTRRLGIAYGLFLILNLVPAFLSGGLLSMGRLTAVMFPSFVYLATVVPKERALAVAAGFGAFQALVATLFFTWRRLF